MKMQVAILMGSDSDLQVMAEAAQFLDEIGISNEVQVISAHRTPSQTTEFARKAKNLGIKVIIAGAGGSAALPGVIAAYTTIPVIGVPIKSKSLDGIDSLLSIAQMPPGVPVATVGINAAKNAAILSSEIIATCDSKVAKKLDNYKKQQSEVVIKKNTKLQKIGWSKYLKDK